MLPPDRSWDVSVNTSLRGAWEGANDAPWPHWAFWAPKGDVRANKSATLVTSIFSQTLSHMVYYLRTNNLILSEKPYGSSCALPNSEFSILNHMVHHVISFSMRISSMRRWTIWFVCIKTILVESRQSTSITFREHSFFGYLFEIVRSIFTWHSWANLSQAATERPTSSNPPVTTQCSHVRWLFFSTF